MVIRTRRCSPGNTEKIGEAKRSRVGKISSKSGILFALVGCFVSVLSEGVLLAEVTGSNTGQAYKPEIFPQLGHSARIIDAIVSSDKRYVASIAEGELAVRIWDVRSGRELRSLEISWLPKAMAISPDSHFIAVGGEKGTRIWELDSGDIVQDISSIKGGRVRFLDFSPDSKHLLISGTEVLSVAGWSLFEVGPDGEKPTPSMVRDQYSKGTIALFSYDGRLVITGETGDSDRSVGVWDISTKKPIIEVGKLKEPIKTIGVCGPEERIVVSINSSLHVIEKRSGRSLKVYEGFTTPNQSKVICSKKTNHMVVTRSGLNTTEEIFLMDLLTGDIIYHIGGRERTPIMVYDMSDDATSLLTVFAARKNLKAKEEDLQFQVGNYLVVWDLQQNIELTRFLPSGLDPISSGTISKDGKVLIVGSENGTIDFWETSTAKHLMGLKGKYNSPSCVAVSPDNRWLLVVWANSRKGELFDVQTGQLLWQRNLPSQLSVVYFCRFSHENKRVIYHGYNESDRVHVSTVVHVLDVGTGELIRTFEDKFVYLSNDGRWAAGSQEGQVTIYDVDSGQVKKTIHIMNVIALNARRLPFQRFSVRPMFIPNNSHLVVAVIDKGPYGLGGGKHRLEKWDIESETKIKEYPLPEDMQNQIEDNSYPGGRDPEATCMGQKNIRFIFRTWENKLKNIFLWDLDEQRELVSFSEILTWDLLGCSPDQTRIMMQTPEGAISIWNILTGKELVKIFRFLDGQWLSITPEGYYTSSPKGDVHLNVRLGNQVYGIDQFRSQFYRPEVVTATLRLGNREQALFEVLGSPNGPSPGFVPPPTVTIRSPQDRMVMNSSTVNLTLHVNDAAYSLQWVKIYRNGTHVWPRQSRDLIPTAKGGMEAGLAKDSRTFSTTLPLQLEVGDNMIEVRAFNGFSEARQTLTISLPQSAQPPTQEILPNLWILSIGINQYADQQVKSLAYAEADARAIVGAFTQQKGRLFREVHSLIISDHGSLQPTYDTILDNLNYLGRAGHNDVVVLFLAGHGLNDDRGDFYFLPKDAVINPDGTIKRSKAISWREIKTVLDLPGKKLIFADTCHSEGVSKKRTRSADNDRFVKELQEMNAVIFTSSRGVELSQESEDWEHGAFTYAIIEGLGGKADLIRDGKISMKELDAYVSETVPQLTNGAQHPITDTPDGYLNFPIALVP